jgi:hypothetical protein
MKKSIFAFVAAAAFATGVFAASDEVTLSGTGTCAKCGLGKTDKCQNALVVKHDGKEETYLLVQNDVSKKFHKTVCEEEKPITVTGTVKEVNGQKEITASKIELSKS